MDTAGGDLSHRSTKGQHEMAGKLRSGAGSPVWNVRIDGGPQRPSPGLKRLRQKMSWPWLACSNRAFTAVELLTVLAVVNTGIEAKRQGTGNLSHNPRA